MKKTVLLVTNVTFLVLFSLLLNSCGKKEKDPDLDCDITKEFSSGKFSVKFLDLDNNYYTLGNVNYSPDLSSWTFGEVYKIGSQTPFNYNSGSLNRINFETCETGKYTFEYTFNDGKSNRYKLLLTDRVDERSSGGQIRYYFTDSENNMKYLFYKLN
ncbi:MAG: hypothetical protein U0V72_09140 [Cytophagales bacterium]